MWSCVKNEIININEPNKIIRDMNLNGKPASISWINHVKKNKTNIPKSGCKKRTNPNNENNKKFKKKELSAFFLYLLSSSALIIINVGFRNSDGWIEKLKNLIHLLAPLISSWNIGKKDKIMKIKKVEIEKKIQFFTDNIELIKITSKDTTTKIICLLNKYPVG